MHCIHIVQRSTIIIKEGYPPKTKFFFVKNAYVGGTSTEAPVSPLPVHDVCLLAYTSAKTPRFAFLSLSITFLSFRLFVSFPS